MAHWRFRQISDGLNMRNPTVVRPQRLRKNHVYHVKLRPKAWSDIKSLILDPLIEELLEKKLDMPRVIIYCNDYQLSLHSRAYHYIMEQLGPDAYVPGTDLNNVLQLLW